MNLSYKKFIVEVLEKSSEIALSDFGKVSGTVKKDDPNQVLTKTDLKIGKYIIDKIKLLYPKHNIIDEEVGVINKNSEFTWVIDPIDGTSNFAVGNPLFGIMIGLLKDNIPIAGGISIPYFNDFYIAEKNKGAYNGKNKIHVTSESNLLSSLIAYAVDGHQENPELTKKECETLAGLILNIRNLRATGCCFDAVMVANGKFGGYLNQTSKIWDNVTQQIIIEEAGGIYSDFFGKSMDYTNPLSKANLNFTFCAASSKLHKQLQVIIHKN